MNLAEQYIPMVRLCVIKEKEVPCSKTAITNAEMAVELARNLIRHADREYLLVIPINASSKPVGIEIVSIGAVNEVQIDIKNVFKYALLSNAVGIIAVHNHPSGNVMPSKEDVYFTKKLMKAGELLNVEVLDSLVITDDSYARVQDSEAW